MQEQNTSGNRCRKSDIHLEDVQAHVLYHPLNLQHNTPGKSARTYNNFTNTNGVSGKLHVTHEASIYHISEISDPNLSIHY